MKNFRFTEIDKIVYFGRNTVTEEGVALFWTGSAVEFRIKAKSLYLNTECGYNGMELMLDIVLDGERTQKFVLEKGLSRYLVFNGMNPEKEITVRIIRDTQCMTDDPDSFLILKSIETDGEFAEPVDYPFQMEFIGDSLTSGEGCGLTKREEWIPVIFDAVESYTYKTAELLNARYNVLSQSGWGLYSSWDSNLKYVLPDYYDKVCGTTNCSKCIELGAHEKWDFAVSDPDAVVINLGTNDMNALNSGTFDKDKFILGFKEKAKCFIRDIRQKNNSCFIIWAYGMLGNEMEPYILDAIYEYKTENDDQRVEYLKLPLCTGKDLGVRFHPTPEGHSKTARHIADFIQSLQAFMLR